MSAAVATLLLGLAAGSAGDELSKRDLKNLQGAWRTVSVEIDGKKLEGGFADDLLTIKEGRFEMKRGKDTLVGSLTLDATQEPRHIDTTITAGADKGRKSIGIYYLSGERLMVCYSAAVGKNRRPTEFRTAEGSARALVIYERKK